MVFSSGKALTTAQVWTSQATYDGAFKRFFLLVGREIDAPAAARLGRGGQVEEGRCGPAREGRHDLSKPGEFSVARP